MPCTQPTTDDRQKRTATFSPSLGRFTQPDTIIPDLTNTQSWNRYSYVSNNPINYNDPTGHMEDGACDGSANSCPTPQERLEKLLNEYDIEYTYNGGTKTDKNKFDQAMLEMFDKTSENFANNYMRGMRFTVTRDVGGDYWGIYNFDDNTLKLGDKYGDDTLINEIWHAIDDNSGGELSSAFETYVGASTTEIKIFGKVYYRKYNPGKGTPPSYGETLGPPPNRQEDFAESGEEFFGHGHVNILPSERRWKFLDELTTTGNLP